MDVDDMLCAYWHLKGNVSESYELILVMIIWIQVICAEIHRHSCFD